MATVWDNARELEFLKYFKEEPVLWFIHHRNHKNRAELLEAWTRISEIMNIPIKDLKHKKNSLYSSYRSYRNKIRRSLHLGPKRKYKPCWFAFELMDSFLSENVESNEPSINVSTLRWKK